MPAHPRGWTLGGPPATPTDGHACLGAEEVTRDFAYGEADPLIRKCMLLPWAPADMLDLSSSTPEPPAKYYQVWPCACNPGPSVEWFLECSLSIHRMLMSAGFQAPNQRRG